MGLLEGISPEGGIALGIIVGLLSTGVQSIGLTLQRKSHILEDEKDPHDARRPPHRRRRWQIGMAMFVAANLLGSSVQISTLPVPVLSTLQAAGLVFNSVCASLILGEPFTRWSLWGTVLVCAGALLIAVFGAFPAPAHRLSELLELLGRRPFVIWMACQAGLVVLIAAGTDALAAATGAASTSAVRRPGFRLGRGLAYGCVSGILSAHCLLVAKSAVELAIRTARDPADNQFAHWQAWVLVGALVVLALTQLQYLHRGLKLVSTSVLYPLVFCVYNIVAILDGLIYFRQTDLITPLRACLIALGTAVLLTGVLALSWRLSDDQHPPAVGQSSLAPGLGLVEDTEGEDEEQSLAESDALLLGVDDDDDGAADGGGRDTLAGGGGGGGSGGGGSGCSGGGGSGCSGGSGGSHGIIDEDYEDLRTRPLTYHTFAITPPDRAVSESVEIWDELEDRQRPNSATSGGAARRRRSTSFPAFADRPRVVSLGSAQSEAAAAAATTPTTERGSRKSGRRRRKSTGFPGFKARSSSRGRGLQDAIGGVWKMKWFRAGASSSTGNLPDVGAGGGGPPDSQDRGPDNPPYRDRPSV